MAGASTWTYPVQEYPERDVQQGYFQESPFLLSSERINVFSYGEKSYEKLLFIIFFLIIAYNINEQERHIFWSLSFDYCQSRIRAAEPNIGTHPITVSSIT